MFMFPNSESIFPGVESEDNGKSKYLNSEDAAL